MTPKLTLPGTGTPSSLLHRAGSSYFLQLDNETLLFDCGPFCVPRLLEKRISPTSIDTLFLTHLHYDHFVDYGYLVLIRWDYGVGKIADLNVYGPNGTVQVTEQLFGDAGVYATDLAARTEHPGAHFVCQVSGAVMPRQRPQPKVTEIEDGSVVEKSNWRLRAREVVHVQPQLTCLAYRLETEGRAIVFRGDTAPVDALTSLAAGADAMIHMCHFVNGVVTDLRITFCCSGHLEAARTAQELDVRTLVSVHITEQVEQAVVREQVLHEAAQIFDEQIIFGTDLMGVPLDTIDVSLIR